MRREKLVMTEKHRRLKVLLAKIKVQINMALGEEVNLKPRTMSLLFPAKYKALKRLSKIKIGPLNKTSRDEEPREPKKVDTYTIYQSGRTLYKAGGGRLVRKQNIVPRFKSQSPTG